MNYKNVSDLMELVTQQLDFKGHMVTGALDLKMVNIIKQQSDYLIIMLF